MSDPVAVAPNLVHFLDQIGIERLVGLEDSEKASFAYLLDEILNGAE